MRRARWALVAILLAASIGPGCLEAVERSELVSRFTGDGPVKLYVRAPAAGIDQADARAIVAHAAAFWAERGHDVHVVGAEADANRLVSFVHDSDGHGIGNSCVSDRSNVDCEVQIGLGDPSCNGVWTPFDEGTLTKIAVHEVGHAVGLEHVDEPGHPMRPTISTRYAGFCEITQGQAQVGPGHWFGLSFTVPDVRTASYEVTSESGVVDTCIIDAADWARLPGDDVDGTACEQDARAASGMANLVSGDYRLVVHCEQEDAPCSVTYRLGWA